MDYAVRNDENWRLVDPETWDEIVRIVPTDFRKPAILAVEEINPKLLEVLQKSTD